MVIDSLAQGAGNSLAVPVGLLWIGDLVEQALDNDHLSAEAPRQEPGPVVSNEARAEQLRALRIDRVTCGAELVPRSVFRPGHLVAVVGLEGQIPGVVDQDVVTDRDPAQVLELFLADSCCEIVAS